MTPGVEINFAEGYSFENIKYCFAGFSYKT